MQINLTGFLDRDTPAFMEALWKLLLEAQQDVTGVPRSFVEQKKEEMRKAREGDTRAIDERDRRARLDEIRDGERGGRGGGRGGRGDGRGDGRGRGRGRGGRGGFDERGGGGGGGDRARDSGWGNRGGGPGPGPGGVSSFIILHVIYNSCHLSLLAAVSLAPRHHTSANHDQSPPKARALLPRAASGQHPGAARPPAIVAHARGPARARRHHPDGDLLGAGPPYRAVLPAAPPRGRCRARRHHTAGDRKNPPSRLRASANGASRTAQAAARPHDGVVRPPAHAADPDRRPASTRAGAAGRLRAASAA